MSAAPFPRYGFMAACCRHATHKVAPEVRAGLEDAIKVLSFCEKFPALLRLLAGLVKRDGMIERIVRELPEGTVLDDIRSFETLASESTDGEEAA